MSRPKKADVDIRNRQIRIRLTEAEFDGLKKAASENGYKSVSEMLRSVGLQLKKGVIFYENCDRDQ